MKLMVNIQIYQIQGIPIKIETTIQATRKDTFLMKCRLLRIIIFFLKCRILQFWEHKRNIYKNFKKCLNYEIIGKYI